jgi:hypothetical protein
MTYSTIRRTFTYLWQHSLIALLCASTVIVPPLVVTTGCNSSQVLQVVTDITKFAPIVTNTLSLACVFTPAAVLCTTGAAIINKDITDLNVALSTYQQQIAAGTATVTAWGILDAVFTTFEKDSAAIFDLFRISGSASQTEAEAVVTSAQTLLAVIEALFPSAPAPAPAPVAGATMRMEAPRARLFAASLPPQGVKFFNLSAWEKDYNKKVSAAHKKNPAARLMQVKVA